MPPRSVPALPRQAARREAVRRARAAKRARRIALGVVLGVVLLVTLLVTAFGSGSTGAAPTQVAPPAAPRTASPPDVLRIATVGSVPIQLPISQDVVTAIAYHGAGDGTIALDPDGQQANEGIFRRIGQKLFGDGSSHVRYYELGGEGPSTGALDVGAPAGSDVYSPVDGAVVAISPYIVDGRRYGSRIDITPTDAPAIVLSLTRLRADPGLSVGSPLASGRSKIGTLIDLSRVERQAIARYTHDAGNHLTLVAMPAATGALR